MKKEVAVATALMALMSYMGPGFVGRIHRG